MSRREWSASGEPTSPGLRFGATSDHRPATVGYKGGEVGKRYFN